MVLQNIAIDQTLEGRIDHRLRLTGEPFDPVSGVALNGLLRDLHENGVQDGVARFRSVDEDERIEIRVDARLQDKLRQHRSDDGAVQVPAGNLVEVSVLLVEEHQDEFFGQAERLGGNVGVDHRRWAPRDRISRIYPVDRLDRSPT